MQNKIPIVMAAFGTTSRAMDTYSRIDSAVKTAFPGHPVRWAYTSRMVRAHMRQRHQANMKGPLDVLDALGDQGHRWAVVQSMHLICGHEFYRLVDNVHQSRVRASMGLPLLTAYADYQLAARAILSGRDPGDGTALVLVGHGTDHPAWTAYPALAQILRTRGGNVHVATIEGDTDMDEIVAAVVRSGARRVRLVPLMLVAGVHLAEDIAGDTDSWKSAFDAAGLETAVETQGLGKEAAIIDLFIQHIRDALAIIPETSAPA
ncbi:sirohydrochlorin cobaltochelatase [Desulfosarcina cetonica]